MNLTKDETRNWNKLKTRDEVLKALDKFECNDCQIIDWEKYRHLLHEQNR